MHTIPDYRRYNLNQLYALLRRIDREKHPDQLALIRSEIERLGGDPDKSQPPVFFVPPREVTALLRVVRWVVGIEYAIPVLLLLNGLVRAPFADAMAGAFFACIVLLFYALFCGIGLSLMRAALVLIRDHAAVEAAWLGALGLAPLSSAFYVFITLAIIDWLNAQSNGFLIVVVPAGFYLPFVLLTYFVKYRYRDDEF